MPPARCSPESVLGHECASRQRRGGEDAAARSPSAASCSTSASSTLGHAVIVFDWDDTLLCTTALERLAYSQEDLDNLAAAVEAILRRAMGMAETMIVTNGHATWVQDSARQYLPSILPTLATLQVVSARALFEPMYPEDPVMWKEVAFRQLLIKDRRTFVSEAGLNLIALGDQLPELKAAHSTVRALGDPSVAKTVRFKDQPSVTELIGQLKRAECELAGLLLDGQSGRRVLLPRRVGFEYQHAVAHATGWELSGRIPSVTESIKTWMQQVRLSISKTFRRADTSDLVGGDLWPLSM
mmetsp:Transcript_10208/g.28998  ORF Transcript_10208/g.28998 Transcript_10208/m.28998 type:complete len:298 (-) Transcript_10208:610-1503(-)